MRSKENVSIPATSPILNQSHAARNSGAFSKHHVSLHQPKLLSKQQSRYGNSANTAATAGAGTNSLTSQVRGNSSSSYGASGAGINAPNAEASYRMMSSSIAATKTSGPLISGGSGPQTVAVTHRSISRENIA